MVTVAVLALVTVTIVGIAVATIAAIRIGDRRWARRVREQRGSR